MKAPYQPYRAPAQVSDPAAQQAAIAYLRRLGARFDLIRPERSPEYASASLGKISYP